MALLIEPISLNLYSIILIARGDFTILSTSSLTGGHKETLLIVQEIYRKRRLDGSVKLLLVEPVWLGSETAIEPHDA